MLNKLINMVQYKGSFKDKVVFLTVILIELLCYPFLIVNNEIRKLFSYFPFKQKEISRNSINTNEVLVCIHEWAGYEPKRIKNINSKIKKFECGLYYQIERFKNYKGKYRNNLFLW